MIDISKLSVGQMLFWNSKWFPNGGLKAVITGVYQDSIMVYWLTDVIKKNEERILLEDLSNSVYEMLS